MEAYCVLPVALPDEEPPMVPPDERSVDGALPEAPGAPPMEPLLPRPWAPLSCRPEPTAPVVSGWLRSRAPDRVSLEVVAEPELRLSLEIVERLRCSLDTPTSVD